MKNYLDIQGINIGNTDDTGGCFAVNNVPAGIERFTSSFRFKRDERDWMSDLPGNGVEGGEKEGVDNDLSMATEDGHMVTDPWGQQPEQSVRIIRGTCGRDIHLEI